MISKVEQKKKVYINSADKSSVHYLDTLEVTSDWALTKTHETFYRRALTKHSTLEKLKSIIDTLNNQNTKRKYWKTYHCNRVFLQNGKHIQGSLCRTRWCTNCNRIKTAELMNGYKQPLLDLGSLYFVTLTAPTVEGRQLKSEIKKRIKAFQSIKDNLRKNYNIKLNGMRKIEVTYRPITNLYHPHFHLILNDLSHAEQLLSLWLSYYPTADIKGQHIGKIDTLNEKSFIELFKYSTKETTKEGTLYPGDVLHRIYSSLEGFRIYQTFGTIRKIKLKKEQKHEVNEIDFIPPIQEIWVYSEKHKDYLSANGTFLINTVEIENYKKWQEQLVKIQNTKDYL